MLKDSRLNERDGRTCSFFCALYVAFVGFASSLATLSVTGFHAVFYWRNKTFPLIVASILGFIQWLDRIFAAGELFLNCIRLESSFQTLAYRLWRFQGLATNFSNRFQPGPIFKVMLTSMGFKGPLDCDRRPGCMPFMICLFYGEPNCCWFVLTRCLLFSLSLCVFLPIPFSISLSCRLVGQSSSCNIL